MKSRKKGKCEERRIALYSESIVYFAKKEIRFEVKTSQYWYLGFCFGKWRCGGC